MHPDELAELVIDLHKRYPRYPLPTLERLVRRVAAQYEDARVTSFVAILVGRQASEQLDYTETIALPDAGPTLAGVGAGAGAGAKGSRAPQR